MFVIELTYKAALPEIDRHMKAHVAFLNQQYAAGRFVVSGRKIPREGGINRRHRRDLAGDRSKSL